MELKNAAGENLKRLYHYQPFSLDRLKAIAHDKSLYFSNPKDFNDPWDCKPWWNIKGLANPQIREAHIKWFTKAALAHDQNANMDDLKQREITLRNNPADLIRLVKKYSSAGGQMINEKYRVFCLSSEPDDELMWAHYTSKHQGICLEFDTKNELFSFALKVTYHEDYPVLDLTSTAVEQTLAPFLTKSQAWEYESEYRIVAREDKIDPPSSFPVTKNNFLKIPDGALTSIIVGCMVEDSTISEIKNVIEQSTQPIELKYARQVRDQFKLSIT